MEPCDIINCFYFMEKMNGYEAPVIEIIEVEVEKGFAASNGNEDVIGGGDAG